MLRDYLQTNSTYRVNSQQSTRNRGGRPAKAEENRATEKISCWVTVREKEQLLAEHIRAKNGGQLVFGQFLKQKLLTENRASPTKVNEGLLTILISLQERGRQLATISQRLEAEYQPGQADTLVPEIKAELVAIQETLTRISQWLFDS